MLFMGVRVDRTHHRPPSGDAAGGEAMPALVSGKDDEGIVAM